MKYEEIKKLVGHIVENEFSRVQDYEERDFVDTDIEQTVLTAESEKLFEQLSKDMPKEYQLLLNDYYSAVSDEWVNLCRFYFKEGVVAGATRLEFINVIDGIDIEHIL